MIKKDNFAKRRIWMRGDRERSEYFYIKTDGKELTVAEIRKETAKWEGGGNRHDNMHDRMPFVNATRDAYAYSVKGREKRGGLDIWRIHFDPVKKEIGYLTGDAFILDGSFDIVGVDFLPAKSFFVVKNMKFSLDYAKSSGFWLPSLFTMELEVEIKAVVNLAHVFVTVREEYKDYQVNTGFSDDVFKEAGKK